MSPDLRAERRRALLERSGWAEAETRALAGDASLRSYQRLIRRGDTAVLMDAPPPREDIGPFARVGRWLADGGFSAPEIYAEDREAGFLLLEDLGDDLFHRVLEQGGDEALLYAAAIDVLADIQARPAPGFLAPYGVDAMVEEVKLFVEWTLPHLGLATSEAMNADFARLWHGALKKAQVGPEATVLRDYHAENLIWLPGRPYPRNVGLLDFQDALAGPPAYDLVSLLRDIRRRVSDELVEAMIVRYLARPNLANMDEERFRHSFAILAVMRNVRIMGIFCRLHARDGKPRYLDYLPRLWTMVEEDLAHPALADLCAWFDAVVPAEFRR